MSKRPDYPLVLIEWKDAMTIKDNWHPMVEDIDEPATCVSVGYLVGNKKHVKILYAHIALEDKWSDACGKGNIIIPTKSIVGMKYLKEK